MSSYSLLSKPYNRPDNLIFIIIIIGMPQRGAWPLPCQSPRSLGSTPFSRPRMARRWRHGRLFGESNINL